MLHSKTKNNTEAYFTLIVIIWGMLSFYLGFQKTFLNYPLLFFGFTVIAIMSAIIILYFKNNQFQQFSDSIPLKTIALLHSWRIFAGWAFLEHSDKLPLKFTLNAGYGDLIAGFLGLSIFVFGHTKRNYLVFNIIGFIDFLLAVGTGITLTLLGNKEMAGIMDLPLIIIPLFGVPLSGYTHIVSLKRLFNAKDIKMNENII